MSWVDVSGFSAATPVRMAVLNADNSRRASDSRRAASWNRCAWSAEFSASRASDFAMNPATRAMRAWIPTRKTTFEISNR